MSLTPVSAFPAHQTSRRKFPRLRDAILPAAIAALAAVLTVAALRPNTGAALPVDLRVVSTSDPYAVGATTQATVALHNRGRADIRPRFSVTWLPYPYYWRIISGPAVLQPGAAATYVVEAPDSTSLRRAL
jgi:hypothetical protein